MLLEESKMPKKIHKRALTLLVTILLSSGCNDQNHTNGISGKSNGISNKTEAKTGYLLHKNITTTIFWTGEEASNENGYIANFANAWDVLWMQHYGGIDTPDNRNGYSPAGFKPNENPFYAALPYNDFDKNGKKKKDTASYITWATKTDNNKSTSICKNRWIKIIKGEKIAYAQWEDVGPFEENDPNYVFGNANPKNSINDSAGLDVSPAVRDFLDLEDIDKTSWQFVDEKDVPNGPWKKIVTTRNVDWIEWYHPNIDTSWQWQLQGKLNTSYKVDLYDIDLFDTDSSTIAALKKQGKKVICYFSAGSYEEWREDAKDFPKNLLGKKLTGWKGEKWLDIRNKTLKIIMKKRLDMAKEKGCDGVEADNVDGYANDTGFDLTPEDQLSYNKFIATQARERGLSVGLKNDLDQVKELEPFFDFSVNERCHEHRICHKLKPFIEHNKPVFNAEYARKYVENKDGAREKMCKDSKDFGLQTLVLPTELDDSFRYSCLRYNE